MNHIIPIDYRIDPTARDKRMATALGHWAHQNEKEELEKKDFYRAFEEMYGITKKSEVFAAMKRLWRCKLLARFGELDGRSGRYGNQTWIIQRQV